MVITAFCSCPKIRQCELNTWLSFESASPQLVAQFSVGGNSLRTSAHATGNPRGIADEFLHFAQLVGSQYIFNLEKHGDGFAL
jgi:hypothetical protein